MAFGVSFEVPIATMLVIASGLVSRQAIAVQATLRHSCGLCDWCGADPAGCHIPNFTGRADLAAFRVWIVFLPFYKAEGRSPVD